jgi:hypothetical protein
MFSYYGSKSKVVDYYPAPKHDLIIEPFAGSARYALKYWERDVIINDKYEVVARIWKFLQQCSPSDILGLPDLKRGDKIDSVKFECIEMRWLMGFISGRGLYMPASTVSEWGETEIARAKKRIAADLYKIKHWHIYQGDYAVLPNVEATWFIDPPYVRGGHKYVHSSGDIEFDAFAEWCQLLQGQIIVCESSDAAWLPFVPLKRMNTLTGNTTEGIWTNEPTHYNNVQLGLF